MSIAIKERIENAVMLILFIAAITFVVTYGIKLQNKLGTQEIIKRAYIEQPKHEP